MLFVGLLCFLSPILENKFEGVRGLARRFALLFSMRVQCSSAGSSGRCWTRITRFGQKNNNNSNNNEPAAGLNRFRSIVLVPRRTVPPPAGRHGVEQNTAV